MLAGMSGWVRNNILNPSRWVHWNQLTTTFASLVIVIGGMGGWLLKDSHDQNDALDAQVASQRTEMSDLNETIGDLEAQAATDKGTIDAIREINTELQERVVELERQVQPIPDDTRAPNVRNGQRQLRLALSGDTIDLNSIADNFGASEDLDGEDTAYLTDGSGSPELALESVDVVRIDGGTARYATCAIATGWRSDSYLAVSELQDDRTCLRLESGRYAAIRVEKYGEDFADLAITVWELP